jgi:hypothetical protein
MNKHIKTLLKTQKQSSHFIYNTQSKRKNKINDKHKFDGHPFLPQVISFIIIQTSQNLYEYTIIKTKDNSKVKTKTRLTRKAANVTHMFMNG